MCRSPDAPLTADELTVPKKAATSDPDANVRVASTGTLLSVTGGGPVGEDCLRRLEGDAATIDPVGPLQGEWKLPPGRPRPLGRAYALALDPAPAHAAVDRVGQEEGAARGLAEARPVHGAAAETTTRQA
ncbi:MAG: hypothetical protein M9894_30455 [Planctomycetes bacterium]|nr:hypothetical protein [Planctomycetota bacterium]